jgi:hypothetical protein
MVKRSAHVAEARPSARCLPNDQALDGAFTVVTPAEEKYLIHVYEEWLRAQAMKARYPELLFGPLRKRATPVIYRSREASRLIVRVVQHDTLLPEQHRQLAEFRFHQYVLWHWYDIREIIVQQVRTDPSFDSLPPTTLHACVGTSDGQILAYFAIRPAIDRDADYRGFSRILPTFISHSYRLGQLDRPLFPAEWESFGPAVFASLPALQQTPIDNVREMNCLMRNQVVSEVLTSIAVVEATYTIGQLLIMPDLNLHALVGCINEDARRLLAKLGVPILYAKEAPVIHNHLPSYWSAAMNDSGKFWPFVVSMPDFLANPQYLPRLDEALQSDPHELFGALDQLLRSGNQIVAKAARPTSSAPPYEWFDAPFQPPHRVSVVDHPLDPTVDKVPVRLPRSPRQSVEVSESTSRPMA